MTSTKADPFGPAVSERSLPEFKKETAGHEPSTCCISPCCRRLSLKFSAVFEIVRSESGEVGTELRNTLGGGKTQESGNAEGAEMRKARESGKAECDRIVGRWMNGRVTERQTDRRKEGRTKGWEEGRTEGRKDGTYCAGVKDLASAYVLCPRLTEQCVSFYLEGSGSWKGLRKGLWR